MDEGIDEENQLGAEPGVINEERSERIKAKEWSERRDLKVCGVGLHHRPPRPCFSKGHVAHIHDNDINPASPPILHFHHCRMAQLFSCHPIHGSDHSVRQRLACLIFVWMLFCFVDEEKSRGQLFFSPPFLPLLSPFSFFLLNLNLSCLVWVCNKINENFLIYPFNHATN